MKTLDAIPLESMDMTKTSGAICHITVLESIRYINERYISVGVPHIRSPKDRITLWKACVRCDRIGNTAFKPALTKLNYDVDDIEDKSLDVKIIDQ